MTPDVAVVLDGATAGWISKHKRGSAATLEYEDEYANSRGATPLSLAFPLRHRSHEAGEWLDGLLPPSLELRQQIGRAHHALSQHPVDLLATEIGMDCAGAVQFMPAAERRATGGASSRDSGLDALTDDDICAGLVALRRGAVAWEQTMGRPMSFSLSGAQTKVALQWGSDGTWALPYGNEASTHILKIELPSFPDNIVIEHLCMSALRKIGIPAARTEVAQFESERALVVERFDRFRHDDGAVRRRHQEDLCQATDTPAHQKQQWTGGPDPGRIAGLLWSESDTGEACVRRFADALIANWVLLASDAHAKNYSIVLRGSSARLAPLYDVCSEVPWRTPDEIPYIQMAMRCGHSYNAAEMGRDEWVACAQDLRLPIHEVVSRVEQISSDLPHACIEAANELPQALRINEYVERFADIMQGRSADCAIDW